jgi:hypothetical protein
MPPVSYRVVIKFQDGGGIDSVYPGKPSTLALLERVGWERGIKSITITEVS